MLHKINPNYGLPLFFVYIALGYLYKFLFGSLLGMLITSFAIYESSELLWGVTPFTYGQLITWFIDQDRDVMIAISTSLITILGFLIAFATATSNWKDELKANLKIKAADEIEAFFYETLTLANKCQTYASGLISVVDKIHSGYGLSEMKFLINYYGNQTEKFFIDRDKLVSRVSDVFQLQARYGSIFASTLNLNGSYDHAKEALTKITVDIWFDVPITIPNDPNPQQTFLDTIGVDKCKKFIQTVDQSRTVISTQAGGLRGSLLSPITDFNFWFMFNLFKQFSLIKESIKEITKIK